MDDQLRQACLNVLQVWLAQIRSGEPTPAFLRNREFQATLESLCQRLSAPAEGNSGAPPPDPDGLIHLILSGEPQAGRLGLKHLRAWLSGAMEVSICDPYLLQFRESDMFADVDAYARELAGIFPDSVQKVDIYTNGYAKKVRPVVLRALRHGRTVRHFSSTSLHDRFVIKDRREGKLLGTSFGGFGSKFFAVLDLPEADVQEVRRELEQLCPLPTHQNRGG